MKIYNFNLYDYILLQINLCIMIIFEINDSRDFKILKISIYFNSFYQ